MHLPKSQLSAISPLSIVSSKRNSSDITAGVVSGLLLALSAGCGAESPELMTEYTAIGEARSALQDTSSGNDVFARGFTMFPGIGADISPTLDPVICGDKQYTYMIATQDPQRRYRVLSHMEHRASSWKIQDNNTSNPRTFKTRPACAMIERGPNDESRYVMVGKGDDNKFYASTGTLPNLNPTDPDWLPPDAVVDQNWTLISQSVFSGDASTDAVAADPVMATSSDDLVLSWISGNQVWARHHALPFDSSSNNWQRRVAAPSLPSGVVAVGTPAVTYVGGWGQIFHVVVRGEKSGVGKLYETYFGRTARGHSFCGILCGGMAPSWNELDIPYQIDSSPALEAHPVHGETLYFRTGTDLYQTSGFLTARPFGTLPLLRVHPGSGFNFVGSPSALGNVRQEFGSHLVASRTAAGRIIVEESLTDIQVVAEKPPFKIVNNMGTCLDVRGTNSTTTGTNIQTYNCNSVTEKWYLDMDNKIHAGWDQSFCLDIVGTNRSSSRTNAQLGRCEDVTETWKRDSAGRLQALWDSRYCLDVSGTNNANNRRNVQLYRCASVTETWSAEN